jgi:hypothetical protein
MQTAELPSPAYIQRGNKSKSTPSGHIFPRSSFRLISCLDIIAPVCCSGATLVVSREAIWSEALKRRNVRTATRSMKQGQSTSKPQRTALRLQPDIEPQKANWWRRPHEES